MENEACVTIKCSIAKSSLKNLGNKALLGREYTVYPVTMMVSGAYYPNIDGTGEKQALFFAESDLRKSVPSWNGRPVSLNHPPCQDTCNTPTGYDSQWLGFIFNSSYDDVENKLTSDMWLDNKRGGRISKMLSMGDNVDVSIGAFGDIVREEGLSKGTPYGEKMVNIYGDHLAVLPDSKGACSWSDGCGIRANSFIGCEMSNSEIKESKEIWLSRDTARTPSYDGSEEISWSKVDKSLSNYIKNFYKSKGASPIGKDVPAVDSLSEEAKEWVASKTLLGSASADTERDLMLFPVVNPSTNKINYGALNAVMSGRGSQAKISKEALDSSRNKAEALLKKNFKQYKGGDSSKVNNEKEVLMSTKEDKKFDFDKWMSEAPVEVIAPIKAALSEYDASYNESVDKIIGCEDSPFSKDDFLVSGEKIVPMETVKKLSIFASGYAKLKKEFSDLSNAKEQKSCSCSGDKETNYGIIGASSNEDQEVTSAPFKDIQW